MFELTRLAWSNDYPNVCEGCRCLSLPLGLRSLSWVAYLGAASQRGFVSDGTGIYILTSDKIPEEAALAHTCRKATAVAWVFEAMSSEVVERTERLA